MTRRIIWPPPAEADLEELSERIGRANPRAARRFIEAVREATTRLAEMPELGGEYESANPRLKGLRVVTIPGFRNYLLFYRFNDDSLDVVRVIHGARDLDRLLPRESSE